MIRNDRTPAGEDEGSGKMSGLAADTFQIALDTRKIQTSRILSRFAFSPALAAAVADLAFGQADGRRA
ncbi:hypothetical protein AFCDBAGC_5131 [Methylobacterium cerastii]|uniref:Uncharacterized protein n=1 Tax=Methylobacterium cerastii TaxID=932741 RepID=A0ABQ4QPL4_9HYPH|nr:hypothetical protein [Methylobacterium cerastii]GJD47238.1 hypothetical protein AFCDBAGC_5131 [Methylobacterium cerastii]